MSAAAAAAATVLTYDLFISYPKSSKWKSIISNVQYELRNKYKINYWIDYEHLSEISKGDLLKEIKVGIQKSSLFLCFINQDYLTSFNCSEELKYATKLQKDRIFILLDQECERALSALLPNEDDYVKIDAYKDLNLFQICKGDYFQILIDLITGLIQSNRDSLNEERSIMDINNSLKIVISPKLHENDREKLIMFLESVRKSGGGEIQNYEFRNKNYILYLTYKSYETKQRVLSAKKIQFQNYSLLVYDGDEFINEDELVVRDTPVSDDNRKSSNNSPFRAKIAKKSAPPRSKSETLRETRNVEKSSVLEKKHWLMVSLQFHRYRTDTPHHAALMGTINSMPLLLQNGATVNDEDGWNMTALHIAANAGQFEFIRYLLKQNADINKQSFNGFTPLHMACIPTFDPNEKSGFGGGSDNEEAKAKIVEYLCSKGATMLRCSKGWLPFHYACFNDMKSIVNFFLKFTENLNADEVTGANQTALHLACSRGNLKLVKHLVSNGANINNQDIYGRACLHIASRKGDLKIVRFLIDNKAHLNLKNGNGETALHYACWNGHEELARCLLEHNADVNAQTDKGETSLHYASRRNFYNIVEELLHNGANKELEDVFQKTPITIASKYSRYPVEELLRTFERVE